MALLSFFPDPKVGNAILFLATVISIAFIFLMFEGLIPHLDKYLFSTEKAFDRWKLICFIINFFISFFIILAYFLTALSTQITIQFLGWDVLLPALFMIFYFGWNLIQIFYIRIGFEDFSVNINNKIDDKYGISKKKELTCLIFLIVAIIIPISMQLGTFIGLYSYFEPQSGDPIDPLIWYISSNVVVFIIIVITLWRLITLYVRSKKNNSPNTFASIFYILIWIVIWFRSFSFLNSLRSITQPTIEMEVVSRLIDILLMVVTAIMVLKSLGEKVYDSMLLNQNNMPFFLFAFTILYIEGQIIMITGAGTLTGVFADRNQISLINNFLIIIITVIYYWWYSEYSLERRGFILRKRYYPEDVALILNDFKEFLVNNDALDTDKVGDEKIEDFLRSKNLEIQEVKPSEVKPEINTENDLNSEM